MPEIRTGGSGEGPLKPALLFMHIVARRGLSLTELSVEARAHTPWEPQAPCSPFGSFARGPRHRDGETATSFPARITAAAARFSPRR